MKTIATTMKFISMFIILGLASLQLLSILDNRINGSSNNNDIDHLAFALTKGRPITQKLDYAHFLPLTNNTKSHQVKVIVDYTPISAARYAYMKVYAPNGTLIKISSSPNGVNTIAPGKAQFATSISDITVKQVRAYVMFTDSFRNAYYSNPVIVRLSLGQIIQPPAPKSPVSLS